MKVRMLPHITDFAENGSESGIRRVIEAYFKYLPAFGVELVGKEDSYDVVAIHAGCSEDYKPDENLCAITHGLYWSADYDSPDWELATNARVIKSIRYAREVTVPSPWVAEAFQRDMHFSPHVIPHGIDWQDWQHKYESDGYILWNKNRDRDVCSTNPLIALASSFQNHQFLSTMKAEDLSNVKVTGTVSHSEMKKMVQQAHIYLSTTEETFGIGVLEAMASGVPVLGFRYGGNVDLIEHGVSGYLAEPGNMDDLAEGLVYCLQYRDTLGQNARIQAKKWTWESACEKLADVFKLTMVDEPATAAVVIPSYNYAKLVGTAVESAINQDYDKLVDIIVVDDGSTDDGETERVVKELAEKDSRVRYIRKPNGGVATARNLGVASTTAKYISCVDADDQIAPTFLSTLIPHLEEDNSLGLVYSKLKLLIPRGNQMLALNSLWPHECDFDAFVRGENQVPTCNVFRRKAWMRMGGQRQRYAPRGAGTEDANGWFMLGSYGWGIKMVTEEPLFLYLLGGRTTGSSEYKEVNYLQWHPWASDGQHPFASIATPVKHSHLVRNYSKPVVSIVIPVGPGHEKDVVDALDSCEAQLFRQWEVIVVDDTGSDELDMTAFPFARLLKTPGKMGAGYARNRGAEIARGKFLLFLDADDWLYPDALWRLLEEYASVDSDAAIYGDHNGHVIISEEYARKMEAEHRLLQYRKEDGHALIRFFRTDYDWMRAVQQPDKGGNFYIWCNITTMIPTSWFFEIGGFDEKMESWEDWDFWIRLARAGKCFIRINEPLFVYRFFSGSRRWAAHPENEEGRHLARNLVQYMRDKYAGGDVVPCTNCGGRRARGRMTVANDYPSLISRVTRDGTNTGAPVNDADFVLCEYQGQPPGNMSEHSVVGTAIFPSILSGVAMIQADNGWIIDYHYRKAGDKFLVHREDMNQSPGRFRPTEFDKKGFESALPKQQQSQQLPPPPPEPEPISKTLEKSVVVPDELAKEITQEQQKQVAQTSSPTAPPPQLVDADNGKEITEEEAVKSTMVAVLGKSELQSLPGITPGIAEQMVSAGISSYQEILSLGKDGLMQFKGVGDTRAITIIDAINAMIAMGMGA